MARFNMVLAAVGLAYLGGPTVAQSVIPNPSFEAVPSSATGEGLLPTGWQIVSVSPDTYSGDGSYGLSPGYLGNFTGVTAFDGLRWVAGGAFGYTAGAGAASASNAESFGTTLTAALAPGQAYRFDARLHQALRPDLNNPGGYDLYLATGIGAASTATFLGSLDPTTGAGGWEARTLTFTAPADAGSRPFLFLAPYQATAGSGFNAYPGIDALSLTPVPEPGLVLLAGAAGLVVAGWAAGQSCRTARIA